MSDLHGKDRRLAELEMVARSAQLRALRYQLDPHFLFNALNSVAALVTHTGNGPAEAMVENLSDFLRATLELDGVEDVSVEREVELQCLYLAVEQARFQRRLQYLHDIPAETKHLAVPALITQPLLENAVKHGLAAGDQDVTIRIKAERLNDCLRIIIEDDGRNSQHHSPGFGLGMRNVRERLQCRYGKCYSLTASPSPAGYRAIIEMPALDAR